VKTRKQRSHQYILYYNKYRKLNHVQNNKYIAHVITLMLFYRKLMIWESNFPIKSWEVSQN
jgi:hypothetical protein